MQNSFFDYEDHIIQSAGNDMPYGTCKCTTVFFLGILLHIPCIFPLQGLLEYIHGLLQEYGRRSIPGVHIPKSPGIEHLRISWIFGSPVLKHPEVVPVAIPGMFSLS